MTDVCACLAAHSTPAALTLPCAAQVPEPEFEGQTKTRLGNPEVRKIVEGVVSQVSNTACPHSLPSQLATTLLSGTFLAMLSLSISCDNWRLRKQVPPMAS